jgi:hypothetical protein
MVTKVVELDGLEPELDAVLAGRKRGRTLVAVSYP